MGPTNFVKRGLKSLLAALLSTTVASACSSRSSTAPDTGILLEVTLADNAASLALDKKIDRIEFSIAYEAPNQPDEYVLIASQPEPVRDVSGRSLLSDPWKELLVPKSQLGVKVKVIVAARKSDGTLLAIGKLKDPLYQEFLAGKIASRTIFLYAVPPNQSPFIVTDSGCLLNTETGKILLRSPSDYDCDGYKSKDVGGNDCNDFDPDIHPGAAEDCTNQIDDDCNGKTDHDDDTDEDRDGVSKCAGDCDDTDDSVYPGAPEKCDGKDNDCDGWCDGTSGPHSGDAQDSDADGWNTCGTWRGRSWDHAKCAPKDVEKVDCMDDKADVHPYAEEKCDGKDNDCDGTTDDLDQDGDGANDCDEDCDPADPDVHPGAREICNGRDDDCDGWCDASPATLSELTWDQDGDGWTSCGSHISISQSCSDETDCNDDHAWIFPGSPELCDGYDTDCDPNTGFVSPNLPACYAWTNGDCSKGSSFCDDSDPDNPWHCSVEDDSAPFPDRICHDYETCYAAYREDPSSNPSPMACINDLYDTSLSATCSVLFTSEQVRHLCGYPPYHELPRCNGCSSCRWSLFVPEPSPGWNIHFGLIAPMNLDLEDKGQEFDPCRNAEPGRVPVLVAEPPSAWSNSDSVTVSLVWEPDTSAPPAQVIQVTIRMQRIDTMCLDPTPDIAGMHCDDALSD